MALDKYDGSVDMAVLGLMITVRFTVRETDETEGPGIKPFVAEDWEAINRSSGEPFGEWFYNDLKESGEEETVLKAVQAYIDRCPHND